MRKLVLCFALLAASVGADPTNYVSNGTFDSAPDPARAPGTETRNETYYVPLTTNDLEGWHFLTGHPVLMVGKRAVFRYVALRDARLTQEVPTQPGHTYRLRFVAACEVGSAPGVSVAVTFGTESAYQAVPPGQSRGVEWKVEAKQSTTPISLASTGGKTGAMVGRIELQEIDPAAEALRAPLLGSYAVMDRARKRAEVEAIRSLLSDDFAGHLAAGDVDAAGYLRVVGDEARRTPTVSSSIGSLVRNEGSVTVDVDRRVVYNGQYGKRVTDVGHFRDVWVLQGEMWKLRSSQELSHDPAL